MITEKKHRTFNEENFEREVLQSREPVLVDFWAEWCGPCLAMGPVIDALAEDFDGVARVGKVDIDQNSSLAAEYAVNSIPTLLLFKEGRIVEQVVGVVPRAVLAKKLEALLPTGARD